MRRLQGRILHNWLMDKPLLAGLSLAGGVGAGLLAGVSHPALEPWEEHHRDFRWAACVKCGKENWHRRTISNPLCTACSLVHNAITPGKELPPDPKCDICLGGGWTQHGPCWCRAKNIPPPQSPDPVERYYREWKQQQQQQRSSLEDHQAECPYYKHKPWKCPTCWEEELGRDACGTR